VTTGVFEAATAAAAATMAATLGAGEPPPAAPPPIAESPPPIAESPPAITMPDLPEAILNPSQWAALFSGPRLTGDWLGARQRLLEQGIGFEASLTVDWVGNVTGGLATGMRAPWLLDLQLDLDLDRLLGWEGGEIFALGQIAGGGSANASLVGALQSIDNIETDPGIAQLGQAWFRQSLFGDAFAVQIGKLDVFADFASPPASQSFINSAMDSPAAIDPMAVPTYPSQAFGLLLQARPSETIGLQVGIYDGSNPPAIGAPSGGTGGRGARTALDNEAGYFVIGEADLSFTLASLPGVLGIGGWGHTGRFDRFGGGERKGAQGGYAYLQQTLWLADETDLSAPSLSMWLIGGLSQASVDPVAASIAGGILWNGPLPGRPNDSLGLGIAYAWASDAAGSPFTRPGECVLEAYYQFQLTPWMFLQPDLQIVTTPGAGGEGPLGTAVVGILRVSIEF
jgi:porin